MLKQLLLAVLHHQRPRLHAVVKVEPTGLVVRTGNLVPWIFVGDWKIPAGYHHLISVEEFSEQRAELTDLETNSCSTNFWRNKRLIGGGCYTNPQPWGGRKAYLDTRCILSWSDASTKCKEPTPFSPELPWPMFVCPGQRCHWLFCRVADGAVSNVLKLEVVFFRSSFVRYAIWIISKKFSSNYHMLMPSPPSTTPCKGEDKAGWFGGQMDPVWGKQWTLWTLKPTKWGKKNCFNHYRVVLSHFIMKIYHPIAKDDRIIVDQPF